METLLCHYEPSFLKTLTERMDALGIPEGAYCLHHAGCMSCNLFLLDMLLYRDKPYHSQRYMIAIDKFNAHIDQWLDSYTKAHNKKTTRYELGAREFTLTYSPKWFDDNEARIKMINAIDKLIKYYKDEIIELRAVGEVGTNGLSHVHCFYKLTGGLKITDKNFKRAWTHWNPKKPLQKGFEGGHHATVKNESDFLGYIDKDIETAWLDKTFSRDKINAERSVSKETEEDPST